MAVLGSHNLPALPEDQPAPFAPRTIGLAVLFGIGGAAVSAYVATQMPGAPLLYVLAVIIAAGSIGCATIAVLAPGASVRTGAVTAAATGSALIGFAPIAIGVVFIPAAVLWLVVAFRYEKRHRVAAWKLMLAGLAGVATVTASLGVTGLILLGPPS